jgi:hypothetical protein
VALSDLDRSGGTIRVEGARQLRRTLKQAGDDLSDLKAAHLEAAQLLVPAARQRTPIGPTGRLAKSVRAGATKSAALLRAGSSRVPYAGAVHWGRRVWPNIRYASVTPSGRRKHNSFIKPRLFLTESAKELEPRWVAVYERALEQAIDKVKGATP